MAPTFDEDKGADRLHSLWSAGQDLTAAAANRSDLEVALEAAQREYDAALAARSALLGALASVQAAYAAAHVQAVAAGWSAAELSEAGLPSPAARHSDLGRPEPGAASPPEPSPPVVPSSASTRPAAPAARPGRAPSSGATIPTPGRRSDRDPERTESPSGEPTPEASRDHSRSTDSRSTDSRSTWDAQQSAFLVTSRSTDNPVWYESMRYSRISPATDGFDGVPLDSPPWRSMPTPLRPVDDPDGD